MKICEYCEYWTFPTNTLYQRLRVEGFCTEGVPKQTAPGFKCEKYIYDQKTEAFHLSVGNALRMVKRKEFGVIMNNETVKETEVQALERKLRDAKTAESAKELDSIVKNIDKLNITPVIPQNLVPVHLKAGDLVHVIRKDNFLTYTQAFSFIYARRVPGKPAQMVLQAPDGTLHVFCEDICEFRIPH